MSDLNVSHEYFTWRLVQDVAEENGYFEAEDVDADLSYFAPGTQEFDGENAVDADWWDDIDEDGGTRGVSAVDVSTDGGSTWTEAALSEPLPAVDGEGRAADAWRQWQYSYEPPGETHEVVVRMIDESGTVQTEEETGPYPTGPSGWVSQEFQS